MSLSKEETIPISKEVCFAHDLSRWTIIESTASNHTVGEAVKKVQTCNDAHVNVTFVKEEEMFSTHVDITLGEDEGEKLRIGLDASEQRRTVKVAEEPQPSGGLSHFFSGELVCNKCGELGTLSSGKSTCDMKFGDPPKKCGGEIINSSDGIGSYDPTTGRYLSEEGEFVSQFYQLDLQKKREENGEIVFETVEGSSLEFRFQEEGGKSKLFVSFEYGINETKPRGFDFEVSGTSMILNYPQCFTSTDSMCSAAVIAPTTTSGSSTFEVKEDDRDMDIFFEGPGIVEIQPEVYESFCLGFLFDED